MYICIATVGPGQSTTAQPLSGNDEPLPFTGK